MRHRVRRAFVLLVCAFLAGPVSMSFAQGVTTASVTGLVKDAQGGVVPGATVNAVHQPSGTSYETVTQGDGRYFMPGMRIGGPYKVTVELAGFTPETQDNVNLTLGVAQDINFTLRLAAL